MSKQDREDENPELPENTITYVFIPDEEAYGTVVRAGAWSSLIQYYYGGLEYNIEIPNDEFRIVDEIGIGYVDETEEDL